jgi:hypothetical protein
VGPRAGLDAVKKRKILPLPGIEFLFIPSEISSLLAHSELIVLSVTLFRKICEFILRKPLLKTWYFDNYSFVRFLYVLHNIL